MLDLSVEIVIDFYQIVLEVGDAIALFGQFTVHCEKDALLSFDLVFQLIQDFPMFLTVESDFLLKRCVIFL